MVRKLTTWVVVGVMGLGIVSNTLAGTPPLTQRPNRPAENSTAKKRVPASRLVRPKKVAQLDDLPVRESPPAVDLPSTERFSDEPAPVGEDLPADIVPETNEALPES